MIQTNKRNESLVQYLFVFRLYKQVRRLFVYGSSHSDHSSNTPLLTLSVSPFLVLIRLSWSVGSSSRPWTLSCHPPLLITPSPNQSHRDFVRMGPVDPKGFVFTGWPFVEVWPRIIVGTDKVNDWPLTTPSQTRNTFTSLPRSLLRGPEVIWHEEGRPTELPLSRDVTHNVLWRLPWVSTVIFYFLVRYDYLCF